MHFAAIVAIACRSDAGQREQFTALFTDCFTIAEFANLIPAFRAAIAKSGTFYKVIATYAFKWECVENKRFEEVPKHWFDRL